MRTKNNYARSGRRQRYSPDYFYILIFSIEEALIAIKIKI